MRGDGPLKRLNTTLSRGAPLGVEELASVGVSSALANYYVKTDWLLRLGRGTFAFPADELEPYKCIAFLQAKWPHMHLAGGSALRARGLATPWDPEAAFECWGADAVRLPDWFTERFPARYQQRCAPTEKTGAATGTSLVEIRGAVVLASEPERAVLEVLSSSVGTSAAGLRAMATLLRDQVPLRANLLEREIERWPRAGVRAAADALRLGHADKSEHRC